MKRDVIPSPRDIIAFSDVEGRLDLLECAVDLADLPGHPERVVAALGDYVDRGPDSAGVLYALKELSERHPGQVVVLMGNHEVDWLEWLDADDEDYEWLAADTALVTTRSFLGSDIVAELVSSLTGNVTDPAIFAEFNAVVKVAVKAKHTDLIAWVRDLPLIWETDTHIWVHAGVEEDLGENWRLGTSDHTLTHKFPPTFGKSLAKTVVAGHVSTEPMHSDGGHGIFADAGHTYLDGDIAKNGDLNVLRYDCESGSYEHHVLR